MTTEKNETKVTVLGKDEIIRNIDSAYYRQKPLPEFGPGDMIKIWVRLKEGEKERLQAFEGLVLGKKGGGLNKSFTLRRVVSGVGLERTFLYHSPNVDKIEVIRRGKVNRAKIYYIRDKKGKEARIKERRD